MKRSLFGLSVLAIVTTHYASAQTRLPDHWYTSGGIDLGKPEWHSIAESESAVRFTIPQEVKLRQAATLRDRNVELLTLRNNATLTYTRLYDSRADFGSTGVEQAAAWLRNTVASQFYADRGITYDDREVKRAGELAYLVKSSASAACFVFRALIGDSQRRDQDISGGVCQAPNSTTPAALEQEMLSILSHARFAQSTDRNSFTVSFQIPDVLISTAGSTVTQLARPSPTDNPVVPSAGSERPMSGRDALAYLEGRWTSTDCKTSYSEFKFTRSDRLEAVYNYVYLPNSRQNLRDQATQIRFDDKGAIVVYWPDTAYTAVVQFHGPDLRETTDTDKQGLVSHRVYQRCK